MEAEKVILQFSCPDKPGILAAVTQFLFKNDAAQRLSDHGHGIHDIIH